MRVSTRPKITNGDNIIHDERYEINTLEEYLDGVIIHGSEIPSNTGNLTVKCKPNSGGEWNEWHLPEYSDGSITVYLKIHGEPPEINFSHSISDDC
ncbi:hypothetical protein ACFR99_13645 [Haloarchaeobius amylolyticus]|uniref:Uncharacterized protein n=1 Tax=Haloarchaeobius amylolyticus TaxID=1198296 RepID=A0ABD6BHP5_9EURY